MKEIRAAAGQRVRVIRRAFSSVPMDYRFHARAAKPGETLAGTIEVRRSRWILPGSPVALALQATNVVSAGFWDTFVAADVVPGVDTIITIHGGSIRHRGALLAVALLVIVVAAAMLMMFRV